MPGILLNFLFISLIINIQMRPYDKWEIDGQQTDGLVHSHKYGRQVVVSIARR